MPGALREEDGADVRWAFEQFVATTNAWGESVSGLTIEKLSERLRAGFQAPTALGVPPPARRVGRQKKTGAALEEDGAGRGRRAS